MVHGNKRSFTEAFAEVASDIEIASDIVDASTIPASEEAIQRQYGIYSNDETAIHRHESYGGEGWAADSYGPFDLDLSWEPDPMSILYAASMEMEAIQRGVSLGVSDSMNVLLKELRGFKYVFRFPYRAVSEHFSSGA